MPSKRSLRCRVAALVDGRDRDGSDSETDSLAFTYTVVDRNGEPTKTEMIAFHDRPTDPEGNSA